MAYGTGWWILLPWALVMIAVPIVAARGVLGRVIAISAGVVAQVATVLILVASSWDGPAVLATALAVPALGWVAEFIGSRTGIPFGRYRYTRTLQPQLGDVPILIPLAWLMMMPPSWAIAEMLVPDAPFWLQATVAGYAFMAWDVYLDPHLTKWDFWRWQHRGVYEGIPSVNFLGWFAWATVISAVVLGGIRPAPVATAPLVVIYIATWLLQAGGHAAFWKWPRSAGAGFIAMGVVAAPVAFRLIR